MPCAAPPLPVKRIGGVSGSAEEDDDNPGAPAPGAAAVGVPPGVVGVVSGTASAATRMMVGTFIRGCFWGRKVFVRLNDAGCRTARLRSTVDAAARDLAVDLLTSVELRARLTSRTGLLRCVVDGLCREPLDGAINVVEPNDADVDDTECTVLNSGADASSSRLAASAAAATCMPANGARSRRVLWVIRACCPRCFSPWWGRVVCAGNARNHHHHDHHHHRRHKTPNKRPGKKQNTAATFFGNPS